MIYIILCLVIMALVTYLPRVIPICVFKNEIKSKFIKSFLYYMPYSVLAALTYPAIFYATGNIYVGIITSLVISILSLFKKINMILLVLIAVLVAFSLSFLF